jgi:hypothetical protein
VLGAAPLLRLFAAPQIAAKTRQDFMIAEDDARLYAGLTEEEKQVAWKLLAAFSGESAGEFLEYIPDPPLATQT